jgi:hypothetical protein
MTHALDGCWAKLERAHETIGHLNSEMADFFNATPKPYEVVTEFQNDGLEYTFIVKGNPNVPLRFAVIAGEVIYHIRSSIEHLAIALVYKNGCTPTVNTRFPVCATPEAFEESIKRRHVEGMSQSAVDLIRAQQPYFNATPEDHFLSALHDFNIQDKHRLLLLVAAAAKIGSAIKIGTDEEIAQRLGINPGRVITGLGEPSRKKISKEGVKVFSIALARTNPSFKAEAEIVVQVVFEQCGLAKFIPVTNVLTGMLEATGSLINKFSPEFN